jgi:hypothetical protein
MQLAPSPILVVSWSGPKLLPSLCLPWASLCYPVFQGALGLPRDVPQACLSSTHWFGSGEHADLAQFGP